MPTRTRHGATAALIVAAIIGAGAIGSTAAQDLFVVPIEGKPIPIPGSDCVVSVIGWENESWVEHDAVTGRDRLVVGKPTTSKDAESDVNDVRRWLTTMLENSEDMRLKTRGACEALGLKHIAIRVVRNDKKLVAGRWWRGSNLFMVDLGDIEVLGKHIEPVGQANPSLVDSATLRLASLLLASTIPHEMDHMRRAREQKPRDELEQLAVDDENQVASELKIRNYSRDGYGDGKYLNYTVERIKLRVNLASAGEEVLKAAQDDPHYFQLDAHDDEALRQVSGPPANTSTGKSRSERDIGSIGATSRAGSPPANDIGPIALRPGARSVFMPSSDDDWSRNMRLQIALMARVTDSAEARLADAAASGTEVIDTSQEMGGSAVGWADNQVVVAQPFDRATPSRGVVALNTTRPRPFLWAAPTLPAPAPQAPPVVEVLFTSLGVSSGDAVTMTVMTTSREPVQFLGEGFVLEPVSGLSARDAERRLSRAGGRRATATIAAYCLQMPNAPPRAGQIFRLAPQAVQNAHAAFARLMHASRQVRDQLRPDSDPDEYFHAIRQWAVWSVEEEIADEAAFTRAVIEQSKKNLAATGGRWAREIEDAIRGLTPHRWHDVRQVLTAAGR
jgi:hypothetical protein